MTTTKSVTQEYFDWLYKRVREERDYKTGDGYRFLCDKMHQIPFRATVPHDDNREADGQELRNDFMLAARRIPHVLQLPSLIMQESSIFEVLIALAKRGEFMIDWPESEWFHMFVSNLGLSLFSDAAWRPTDHWKVERKLNKFNNRRYSANGRGGIFPLHHPDKDQREVELWYQMAAYMAENEMY